VNAAAFDPNDSGTIYVGTDGGVYRTTDGGTVWEAFDNGIPNVVITDLTIDPEDELLVAATYGRGMYKVSIAPGNIEPAVDLYLRRSKKSESSMTRITGSKVPASSSLTHASSSIMTLAAGISGAFRMRAVTKSKIEKAIASRSSICAFSTGLWPKETG